MGSSSAENAVKRRRRLQLVRRYYEHRLTDAEASVVQIRVALTLVDGALADFAPNLDMLGGNHYVGVGMAYHSEINCYVDSVTYNAATLTAIVKSPPQNVPDMSGCTSVIASLHPDVLRIEHWEGGRLSTVYSREYGSWTRRRDQER